MSKTPRLRRIYTATFRFVVGQLVRCHDRFAIVIGRLRSANGVEIYEVALTGDTAGRPIRTFLGEFLEPITSRSTKTRARHPAVRPAAGKVLLLPEMAAA